MATPSQDAVSQASSTLLRAGHPCATQPPAVAPSVRIQMQSSTPAPAPSQDHKQGSWGRGSGQREASGRAGVRETGTLTTQSGTNGLFAKSPRFEGLGILVKSGRQQWGPRAS